MTSFHRSVYRLVMEIPHGRVATYGQIAALLGAPRSARAVGYAMRHCPSRIPWHRVVNARGAISRRANAGGMLTQRLLLQQEGVSIRGGRIVRLERHRWRGRRGVGSGGRRRGRAASSATVSNTSIGIHGVC